jgi:hypothetical protein
MVSPFFQERKPTMAIRHVATAALALAAGSVMVALPSTAGAAPAPAPVPQYIVQFSAIASPPATTGLTFHSTSCAIGPATNPIVTVCQENGTITFLPSGGSGTATVTSVLSTIHWHFKLHRATATGTTYRMTGTGKETVGTTPVLRPVKVTGTLTVLPTPDPTLQGTEDIFPLPISAG